MKPVLKNLGRNERGVTLVELMLAAGIMAIIAVFIGTFLMESFGYNQQIQSVGDLGNYSQQSVNQMRQEMSQSKRLFDNSVSGRSYWEQVVFATGLKPLTGSKLPEIVPHGSFSPSNRTNFRTPFIQESIGNILFFATYEPARQNAGDGALVDLYRFVAIYLVEKTDAKFNPKTPHYLELMRCRSGLYADLGQVRDLRDDALRGRMVDILQTKGVQMLWDSQQPADVAFTELRDYTPGKDPLVKPGIALQECRSAIGGLGRMERPAGPLTYSVAYNKDLNFNIRRAVPMFALSGQSQPLGASFPNGFEVIMIGPKSGRQVYLRLVLAATVRRTILTRESSIIATVKDS